MGRFKYLGKPSRVRRVCQRDTPVKPALRIRDRTKKFLPIRHHGTILEDTVLKETTVPIIRLTNLANTQTSTKALSLNAGLHTGSPTSTGNLKGIEPQFVASVTAKCSHRDSPSGHSTNQRTPELLALRYATTPVQDDTSEGITSSSVESAPAFSSGEDDYYSSASSSPPSSLPSPEIFRRETHVDVLASPVSNGHLGLRPCIKNSTLMDESHAKTIYMYNAPDLSPITDVSPSLAEKKGVNQPRETEPKVQLLERPLKSDGDIRCNTPPKFTIRRPITYKKKVWFKSPIISPICGPKCSPATSITFHKTTEPVGKAVKNKPDTDTLRVCESTLQDESVCLTISLNRPLENSPETAKFFDFTNVNEKEAFFQSMRERAVGLRSIHLFPLTAVKPK